MWPCCICLPPKHTDLVFLIKTKHFLPFVECCRCLLVTSFIARKLLVTKVVLSWIFCFSSGMEGERPARLNRGEADRDAYRRSAAPREYTSKNMWSCAEIMVEMSNTVSKWGLNISKVYKVIYLDILSFNVVESTCSNKPNIVYVKEPFNCPSLNLIIWKLLADVVICIFSTSWCWQESRGRCWSCHRVPVRKYCSFFSNFPVWVFKFVSKMTILLLLIGFVVANKECFFTVIIQVSLKLCGFIMGSIRNGCKLNLICIEPL